MKDPVLGKLEKVELRDIWAHEATAFTPWLAREENLKILADALGLELELEAQERSVGPFRADILCKVIGTEHWVLIENQLERTDHMHLGQLLTYAAGLEAATIIWVAATFIEEHRATLDWLNRVTNEGLRFFGVEVELWRIGDSPAAPKFNVVSKPNNWSKSVGEASRAIDTSELSELRVLQLAYWEGLHNALNAQRGPVQGNRKPQPQSWMSYSIGRSYFSIGAVMVRPQQQIRAELYIQGAQAKPHFAQLLQQKDTIEAEIGYPLNWEELPEGSDSRIAVVLKADPEDRSDWPRQHEWLAKRLNDIHRVFSGRVRSLRQE